MIKVARFHNDLKALEVFLNDNKLHKENIIQIMYADPGFYVVYETPDDSTLEGTPAK